MKNFTQRPFNVFLCNNFTATDVAECLIRANVRNGDFDNLEKDVRKKMNGKKRFSEPEVKGISEQLKINKSALFEFGVSDNVKKALTCARALGCECNLTGYKTVVYDSGKQETVKELIKKVAICKQVFISLQQ